MARLEDALKSFVERFEPRLDFVMGEMVEIDGSVEVPNRPNYVYVRMPDREILEVLNLRMPAVDGQWVMVGYDRLNKHVLQILDIDAQTVSIVSGDSAVVYPTAIAAHAHTHEWLNPTGGYDPVNVQLRAFVPLRVTISSGLTVSIDGGIVPKRGGGFVQVASTTIDLTSSVPTSDYRWVLIYVDEADGSVDTLESSVGAQTAATIPDTPSGGVSLAAVLLHAGQTTLSETATSTDIVDLRFPGSHDHDDRYLTSQNILRISSAGESEAYDATDLSTALGDASSGDTILVPVGTITGDQSVPDGVTVRGASRDGSILDGQITLGSDSWLDNLSVIKAHNTASAVYGVQSSSGYGYIYNCTVQISNASTGVVSAAYANAGNGLYIYHSRVVGTGTTAYGGHATTGSHRIRGYWTDFTGCTTYDLYGVGTGYIHLCGCRYALYSFSIAAPQTEPGDRSAWDLDSYPEYHAKDIMDAAPAYHWSNEQIEVMLAQVADVDLNVTTKTTLYTVPAGKSCVITRVTIRDASTSLTTASFGLGFDANATDVVADATHTELTGSGLYTVLTSKAGAALGAATNVFGLKCSTPQGAAATVDVDVFGYLL